jgi:hypothetical protein
MKKLLFSISICCTCGRSREFLPCSLNVCGVQNSWTLNWSSVWMSWKCVCVLKFWTLNYYVRNDQYNNNNYYYLLTAIGLSPGGSGYITRIQNMKLVYYINNKLFRWWLCAALLKLKSAGRKNPEFLILNVGDLGTVPRILWSTD